MASGHARASALIGAGTLVSRLTGLVRSLVLVWVIGSYGSHAADAFTVAVQLPQNIYELLAAGVITGIIVPQIVKAATHRDGGAGFVSKLMTLGTIILVVATAVVMALAPLLIGLYAPSWPPEQHALATAFAYWVLPQLMFYGLYALVGEALNARRVFGPYSWAPTVNNLVSIAGFGVFLAVYGGPLREIGEWDAGRIALLGGTATAGIALQAFVLLFFWRRTGLRVRPDFRWRGMGLRHLGTLAFWTFLTVVAGQLVGIVQSWAYAVGSGTSGAAVVTFAWLIFMLPHSIVAMSISTTYFSQLSELVATGRRELIGANLDESIRAVSVFAFAFTAALLAASVPLSRIFTADGEGALAMSWVLNAYVIALVPFGVLVIVRRAFFAFHDTRTPFFFALVQYGLAAVGTLAALGLWIAEVLPDAYLAAVVALVQSLSNFVQLPVAVRMLRRHTGTIDLSTTWRSLGRFALAMLPALLAGGGLFWLLGGPGGWTVENTLLAAVGAAVIGGASIAVYIGGLALLRAPELAVAMRVVRRFLPGR